MGCTFALPRCFVSGPVAVRVDNWGHRRRPNHTESGFQNLVFRRYRVRCFDASRAAFVGLDMAQASSFTVICTSGRSLARYIKMSVIRLCRERPLLGSTRVSQP